MRSTLLKKREGGGFGCRGWEERGGTTREEGDGRRAVERVWGVVEELVERSG